jgi:hypothetical protein
MELQHAKSIEEFDVGQVRFLKIPSSPLAASSSPSSPID